jgi:hypothetical protein
VCALRSLFWWQVHSWLSIFPSFFGWLTIGKFDCAFVAGELAFSFHIASACDVCCDLRIRRKKKKFSRHRKHWNTKKNPKEISSRDRRSVGALRRIIISKKEVCFWGTEDQLKLRNVSHKIALCLCLFNTEETSQKETSSRKCPCRIILHKWILQKLR